MPSLSRPMCGVCLTATAMLVASTAWPRILRGQRPPPAVVDFGVPGTGEVHSGRLVQWEYWSFTVASCRRGATTLQCSLSIGNGSDAGHAICVDSAFVLWPDGSRAALVSGRDSSDQRRHSACYDIGPHATLLVAYRSAGSVRASDPATLSVVVAERFVRTRKATMTARANIPIVDAVAKPD